MLNRSQFGNVAKTNIQPPVPGTESDSDSILSPDTSGAGLAGLASPSVPLSSIAERHDGSDSEDEGDEEGGWRTSGVSPRHSGSADMTLVKAGYLWKKGERRKVASVALNYVQH